ncbi:MAG: Rv0361 family membrane protein [Solirubrobacterales bacterium]
MGVCVLIVAGCGEGDEDKIRSAVEDFVAASNDRDFKKVCELFGADTRKQLEQQGGKDCQKLLEDAAVDDAPKIEATIQTVTVDGDRATVDARLKTGDQPEQPQRLDLRKEGEDWKLVFGEAPAPATGTEGDTGAATGADTGTGTGTDTDK